MIFAPWLPHVAFQYNVLTTVGYSPTTALLLVSLWVQNFKRFVESFVVLATGLPYSSLLFRLSIAIMGLIGLVVAFSVLRRPKVELWLAWIGVVALPTLVIAAMFGTASYYSYRYAMLALPTYIVLISIELTVAGWRLLGTRSILVSMVIIALVYAIGEPSIGESRGGWTRMARAVEQRQQPGDGLFFAPPTAAPAFRVQYKGPDLAHGLENYYQYHLGAASPEEIDRAGLESFMRPDRRAWIVWQRPADRKLPLLPSGTQIEEEEDFGPITLLLSTMK